MTTYKTAHATPYITSASKQKQDARMKKYRFRTWLKNWLDKPNEKESRNYAQDIASIEGDSLHSDGMKFQLYKASGGYVIETRSYDRIKDRNNTKMYVITEDQDLGEQIGKIITMEALRS